MPVHEGDKNLAFDNLIMLTLVGSAVHGTNLEGTDDRDEMGVCIEPPEYVAGLKRFDQYVYRDANEGERSKHGDLDLTVYSLRKWARLAADGNPSILLPLWAPSYEVSYWQWDDVLEHRQLFVSKDTGKRFLGYMRAQKEKLLGLRGNRTNRPELVAVHGYDTKFAGHLIRLGSQGIELLTTGEMRLPMAEPVRSHVLEIRRGEWSLPTVVDYAASLEHTLEQLVGPMNHDVPERTDRDKVSQLLASIHLQTWKG